MKELGFCRHLVRVSVRVVIAALSVFFAVFVAVYAVSGTGLEWVDEAGRGNGHCHELKDAEGECVMLFRLCNYGNTNNIYELSLFAKNSIDLKFRDEVGVLIMRYSQKGSLLGRYKITDSLSTIKNGVSLPPSCSPESQGEVLLITIDLLQSNFHGLKYLRKEIKASLICKKVHYFPTA